MSRPKQPEMDPVAALYELRAFCDRVNDLVSRAGLLRAGLQCVLAKAEVQQGIDYLEALNLPAAPCLKAGYEPATALSGVCGVEQRLARQSHKLEVAGSSPAPATN